MTQRMVKVIPATISRFTATPFTQQKKRKVAAYARVSTDHEEQLSSYDAQVDYYTNFIKNHEGWEFVCVYADEGISGCNTKNRDGFNRMVQDALAGRIDLIITKSVSRFARNTVDSLTTIRLLKDKGTEVYFEKENIWTFDSKGELLITIMSSLAQEESRSISENVTWGHRKRFADGKFSYAYSHFLGLDYDQETGNLVVNPEEAKTIKLIFKRFLEGMSPHSIARELEKRGIKSPTGRDKWYYNTIRYILSNEKYKGDVLIQKEFTVDYLQKRMKKNEGEVPQYYVQGNHEAIIDPEVFDLVQVELAKRFKGGMHGGGSSIYTNKIICGDCGCAYGPKVWHSNQNCRKIVFRCNQKYEGEKCQTPVVTEQEVKDAFVSAFNKLIGNSEEVITNLKLIRKTLTNTKGLEQELTEYESIMRGAAENVQQLITENAHTAQNQEEYQIRYETQAKLYENAKQKFDEISESISNKKAQAARIGLFIDRLKAQSGFLEEFDKELWCCLVSHVTIKRGKQIIVTFRDGTDILA